MESRDEVVGWVMDFFHVLFPYKPQEQAEGPFPLATRFAEGATECYAVGGVAIQGAECYEGVP